MLALAIDVSLVVLQHQGYLDDEFCLEQVPVVVRHTIGDDVLRPLLETSFDDGLVIFHKILDERIHLSQLIDDIFVNYLEGCHTNQGLLMTMVEVDRHIAVSDTLHIDIEHLSRHLSIAHIASGSIDTSSITSDGHNLTVYASNIAASLGW